MRRRADNQVWRQVVEGRAKPANRGKNKGKVEPHIDHSQVTEVTHIAVAQGQLKPATNSTRVGPKALAIPARAHRAEVKEVTTPRGEHYQDTTTRGRTQPERAKPTRGAHLQRDDQEEAIPAAACCYAAKPQSNTVYTDVSKKTLLRSTYTINI